MEDSAEDVFSSSDFDSDEEPRPQVGQDDSKEAPPMMIVVRNTFIDVCKAEEGKGGQGLLRCHSAPAILTGDKFPSITPQPTTSRQPLVAGTQARSR